MARPNPYDNQNSLKSQLLVEKLIEETTNFSIEDLIEFQTNYGLSDNDIAKLTCHSKGQMSEYKSGSANMTNRTKQQFYLAIKHFKDKFPHKH